MNLKRMSRYGPTRNLGHTGIFTNKDREHQDSRYNVLIEWENIDVTEMGLQWMINENKIPMAQYARDRDLLDTHGPKNSRRVANSYY